MLKVPMIRDKHAHRAIFTLSELKHHYGDHIHLLSNPFYLQLLNDFCQSTASGSKLFEIVRKLSSFLAETAVNCLAEKREKLYRSRMRKIHSQGDFISTQLFLEPPLVVVDLMRAGILPAQTTYERLLDIFPSNHVRQDHLLLNRVANERGEVSGTRISGFKLSGDSKISWIFIPDPMGATGSTMKATIEFYKAQMGSRAKSSRIRFVALHYIVTPEYLEAMRPYRNELIIFALRLDRGLSAQKILQSTLGKYKKEEKGLNANDYIVPGGGGIGEILNNAKN